MQVEFEEGQEAQLMGQGRQKRELEVSMYPVLQDVMTVALEQAAAPVAQLLHDAVFVVK